MSKKKIEHSYEDMFSKVENICMKIKNDSDLKIDLLIEYVEEGYSLIDQMEKKLSGISEKLEVIEAKNNEDH